MMTNGTDTLRCLLGRSIALLANNPASYEASYENEAHHVHFRNQDQHRANSPLLLSGMELMKKGKQLKP